MSGDGVSHGHERPCSLAFCGQYAMQFTKCHTTAMSFSVLESIFPVWLQMLVPMSQATTHASLCTASLRRQLCHFRIQIALGWNWLSRVEMQQGMVGGRVGFLVAGLLEGVRGIIEKVIFRPAIFCMLPFNVASHLCCYFGVFRFFRVLGGLTCPEPKFRPLSTSKWAKGSQKPNFDPHVFFRSLQRPCRRW